MKKKTKKKYNRRIKSFFKQTNIHKIKKMNHSYEEIKKRIDDNEIIIVYKVKNNENCQKIKSYGEQFVENNKDIC